MSLKFDPIGSPNSQRDLFVDLTGALEAEELLTLATIVSGYSAVLTVSNVAVNDDEVTFNGQTVAAGKGVHFTIETVAASFATIPIALTFEGDSGTSDKYELLQPVRNSLCE